MAKKNETTEEVVVKEDSGIPVIYDKDSAGLDTKGLAEVLKNSKYERSLRLTGEYLEAVEGEEILAMYIGKTRIGGMVDGEPVPAVRLLLADESVKVTASAIIVSALSEAPVPSPVKIVKTGEKKAKVGIMNLFEVSLLS